MMFSVTVHRCGSDSDQTITGTSAYTGNPNLHLINREKGQTSV